MSGALPQLLPEPSATYEGCTHYKRKCHLLAPCCGEFFACRFCHDEVKDDNERDAKKAHKLERKLVTRVRCMRCGTQQKSQQTCESCGVTMGEYYCGICNLFDDQVRTPRKFRRAGGLGQSHSTPACQLGCCRGAMSWKHAGSLAIVYACRLAPSYCCHYCQPTVDDSPPLPCPCRSARGCGTARGAAYVVWAGRATSSTARGECS